MEDVQPTRATNTLLVEFIRERAMRTSVQKNTKQGCLPETLRITSLGAGHKHSSSLQHWS